LKVFFGKWEEERPGLLEVWIKPGLLEVQIPEIEVIIINISLVDPHVTFSSSPRYDYPSP